VKLKTNQKSGFTLLEIMIVVAIIGLLASFAIPNFAKARTTAQKDTCINNLRQIESAKDLWALEKMKKDGDAVVDAEIDTYLKTAPACPTRGTYTYGVVGTSAACSNSTDGHLR
jgi:prepilin-type N-terminal cleavage/methylation domain-containing protein